MEADDLLCSRNVRPQKDGEGAARCHSCSQNAHGETVLAWKKSASRRARGLAGENVARSEGQFGDSLGREGVMVLRRKQKALAWANGTSREIDCEAIGGWGG